MKKIFTLVFVMALIGSVALGQPTNLRFHFTNPQITGTPPNQQFEYDIELSSDTAGTWHLSGQVYVEYDTTAFGANIALNGGLTATPLALLTGYFIPGTNPLDNRDSVWTLSYFNFNAGIIPVGAPLFSQIPLAPATAPLLHVTMDIKRDTAQAGVAMLSSLMEAVGGQFFYDTLGGTNFGGRQYPVPYVYVNDLRNFSLTNPSLSVDWGEFSAKWWDNAAYLEWQTLTEINNDGFSVERNEAGEFKEIAWVQGVGNADEPSQYSFFDQDVIAGKNYQYRLRQVDQSGEASYSQVVEIISQANATDFVSLAPNLVREGEPLRLKFWQQPGPQLEMSIFDMNGRKVEVQSATLSPQAQSFVWEVNLPPGRYNLLIADRESGDHWLALSIMP